MPLHDRRAVGVVTDYLSLPGMELTSVGMEWPASTGPNTQTLENLVDAMVAANDDPLIQLPRIKIGHGTQLVNDQGDFDPYWDGEPAFGTVANLRLDESGAVLLGDGEAVPDWLANAAPSAYPTRSIEAVKNVTTEGGKRYSMVITAVALGSWTPAVKDLEDLKRLLADGPQEEETNA